MKRIESTIGKGRFAQELSSLIDSGFVVPGFIRDAIEFIAENRGIRTARETE